MRITHATMNDLNAIALLEKACFPPLEAAPMESFQKRIAVFPNHFWLLYEGEKLISCVNGFVSNEEVLTDEMFEKADMHDENGAWQMVFGVLTHPDYQMKGYASRVMKKMIDDSREQNRKGVILTCKPALIPFYARFCFIDEGVSVSEHGGALWHQMRLTF